MFYLLEEYEDELLWSGDIFRVFIQNKGENYYTDRVVDFIIFETEDVDRPLGLLSISGYKVENSVHLSLKKFLKRCDLFFDKNWIEKNIYDYLYLNKECDKVFISKMIQYFHSNV